MSAVVKVTKDSRAFTVHLPGSPESGYVQIETGDEVVQLELTDIDAAMLLADAAVELHRRLFDAQQRAAVAGKPTLAVVQ